MTDSAETGASIEEPGIAARRVAFDALNRISEGGAYANLVLSPILDRSTLSDRDRRFATELVYGPTRMARACDHEKGSGLRERNTPPGR